MKIFDYDLELQNVFNRYFSDIHKSNWKNWLDISSKDNFIDLCLSNSGLSSDVLDQIDTIKTDPRELSIDAKIVLNPKDNVNGLDSLTKEDIIITTHTSGTSGGDLESLKWYHFSRDLIERLWAPGMRAIFESSDLNHNSSAIIFLPSRIKYDGLITIENKKLARLYSSEFSQRLVISLIKPESYLIDAYKNSNNLETIAKMLSMENISVLSAPASTILRWADIDKFKERLLKTPYDKFVPDENLPITKEIYNILKNHNIEKASKLIQKKISDLLSKSDTTLIMSTTSLKEEDWRKISKFLNKKRENIKFTSLYVGSEAGPFAATIDHNPNNKYKLVVFPLTLPIIERQGKKEIISRTDSKFGNLLISRMANQPIINIDIGDVISIEDQNGIPKISEKILRTGFKLKTEHDIIGYQGDYDIYAGDYFDFIEFEIIDPRSIIACLQNKIAIKFDLDNPLFIVDENPKKMILSIDDSVVSKDYFKETIINCPGSSKLESALLNSNLVIEFDNIKLEPKTQHSNLLDKVRKGELPKGILKKWQFYVLKPK